MLQMKAMYLTASVRYLFSSLVKWALSEKSQMGNSLLGPFSLLRQWSLRVLGVVICLVEFFVKGLDLLGASLSRLPQKWGQSVVGPPGWRCFL